LNDENVLKKNQQNWTGVHLLEIPAIYSVEMHNAKMVPKDPHPNSNTDAVISADEDDRSANGEAGSIRFKSLNTWLHDV
jgi:hypothetical protein